MVSPLIVSSCSWAGGERERRARETGPDRRGGDGGGTGASNPERVGDRQHRCGRGFRMNELVVRALLSCIEFLSRSGDDFVDPDSAVQQLEEIARTLKMLSQEDRRRFRVIVMATAEEEEQQGARADRVTFLRALTDQLGLEP